MLLMWYTNSLDAVSFASPPQPYALHQIREARIPAEPVQSGLYRQVHQRAGALRVSLFEQGESLFILAQARMDDRLLVR